MIEDYHFGSITVDGETYNHDIMILDGKVFPWERKESHFIDVEDIEKGFGFQTIVIGTGESGTARVSDRVKEQKADIVIEPTQKAVDIFNKSEKAAGFFHLTC